MCINMCIDRLGELFGSARPCVCLCPSLPSPRSTFALRLRSSFGHWLLHEWDHNPQRHHNPMAVDRTSDHMWRKTVHKRTRRHTSLWHGNISVIGRATFQVGRGCISKRMRVCMHGTHKGMCTHVCLPTCLHACTCVHVHVVAAWRNRDPAVRLPGF